MQGAGSRKLILALDVATMEEALALADVTGDYVGYMKVGLRLFTSEGPELVRALKDAGHGIFLDLKFHDIPSTVADASRSATALGVDFFTVHTPGGEKMLRACVKLIGPAFGDRRLWMEVFERCGIDPTRRPAELGPGQYVELANAWRDRAGTALKQA